MYAIVKTGGKQYNVEPGKVFETEKLDAKIGDKIELDVLMVVDGKKVSTGTPFVKGTKAICEVVSHGKGVKLNIFTYKAKKRVRKKQGHRQLFTALKVLEIVKK
jgi:large subunit ribosomal protein L21